MKNKTANDYLKKYKSLQEDLNKLEQDVKNDLLNMCIQHPDAPVAETHDGITIKARGIGKPYIDRVPFDVHIAFMMEIEKHLQKDLPVQLEIPFNK